MIDDVDVAALARLRPGMSVSALESALGSRWVPPAAHQEGRVDAVTLTHGFRARVDRAGHLGQLEFLHNFSPSTEIDGLRIGMTAVEVGRARPEIVLPPEKNYRRLVTARSPGGILLHATITMDTLNMVSLVDPTAVYPEKEPFPYPPPSGDPGAPFRDPNLKLAVLSTLLDKRLIDLDTPEALVAHVEGRPFDDERDSYAFNAKAYDYLARYPLSDKLLQQVTSLSFDGGNSANPFAYLDWNGETDHFEVLDLEGLAACQELRSFHCNALLPAVDLRQLRALHHLEKINIWVPCTHIEALLDMPALKTCSLADNDVYHGAMTPGHPTRHVLDLLKERGVRVGVRWISSESADGAGPPPFS